jgi:ankyrin repeat protein
LLQHRADVKEQNDWDDRSSDANTEIILVLLEHGANVTARDNTHSTPLHLAVSIGSPETVRLLIKHGADVNALNGDRKMPLHLVLAGVSVKIAYLLLQHMADMKEQNDEDDDSVYHRGRPDTNAEIIPVLLEHGADVTARDDTHSMPLHLAASRGSPDIVQLLIKHDADVNALDGNLKTPLHLLLLAQVSVKTEGFLLQRRTNVKEQNDKGNSKHGRRRLSTNTETMPVNTETIQVLLEHGADVTARDETHTTPLHLAASIESPEIVRLLIQHGADINAPDRNGKMPLHLALAWVSVKLRDSCYSTGLI